MNPRLLLLQIIALPYLACSAPVIESVPAPARQDMTGTGPADLTPIVVYEVFPRVFSDTADLAGVTQALDELVELGVDTIWLMPIHPIGDPHKGTHGSPYSIRDHLAINPDYGTEADLHELVQEAHARSMRVLLDFVGNHTSWDSVLMANPDFYRKDADGNIVTPVPAWKDVAQLEHSNPDVRRYVIDTLLFLVDEYDVDGFRFDAARHVPTDLWAEAVTELRAAKPDVFLLVEAFKPELRTIFDADYSMPLFNGMTSVLRGENGAMAVRQAWQGEAGNSPDGFRHLRFIDNHDMRRAWGHYSDAQMRATTALLFTIDGIPFIYNGQEARDVVQSRPPALFNRHPIAWQPDPEVFALYRDLIALRRSSPALRGGETVWLDSDAPGQLLAFERRAATETYRVLINYSDEALDTTLHAGEGEVEVMLAPWAYVIEPVAATMGE